MAIKSKRRKALASKKAAKKAGMKSPGSKSKYALKLRGIYPANSPYRTIWSQYA